MFPYASEYDAIFDALRLSKGMSYKSALANVPMGGGKSVIIADPSTDKTQSLFEAFGNEDEVTQDGRQKLSILLFS